MPKPPILGPFLPFPDDLVDEVHKKAAKKAFYYTTFVGAAVAAAPYAPKTANMLLELTVGLGVNAKRVVRIKPLILLNFMPSPIGVVNPTYYGLPDEMDDLGKIRDIVRKDGGGLEYVGYFYAAETAAQKKRVEQVKEQLKKKTITDLKFEKDQFNDSYISDDLGPMIRQAYRDEIALRNRQAAAESALKAAYPNLSPAEIERKQTEQWIADQKRFLLYNEALRQLQNDQQQLVQQMKKDTAAKLAAAGAKGPLKDGGPMGWVTQEQYVEAAQEVIRQIIETDQMNRNNPADP